jgi:hypothetical protein
VDQRERERYDREIRNDVVVSLRAFMLLSIVGRDGVRAAMHTVVLGVSERRRRHSRTAILGKAWGVSPMEPNQKGMP